MLKDKKNGRVKLACSDMEIGFEVKLTHCIFSALTRESSGLLVGHESLC